jgi:hypothetical protein
VGFDEVADAALEKRLAFRKVKIHRMILRLRITENA